MSAQQFFLPFVPAIGPNGTVVPGAKLYFYETGSSIPTPVYTSADLATPLSNPVVANGAGKWPAIYFDDEVVYRVVLKDALGATLDEVDPYIGLRNVVTDTEAGVWVTSTGAVGDGMADDTAAIQDAIDTGSNVYFPPGTYLISEGLTSTTPGQRITGAGEGVSIIVADGAFNVFTFGTGGTAYEYAAIERLTIDGSAMTSGYALNIDAVDRMIARNIRLESPWNGVRVHKANVVTLAEIYGQTPQGDYAFHFDGADGHRSDVIRLMNCNFGGVTRNWTGVYAVGPINTVQAIGNTFVQVKRGVHFKANGAAEVGQFQWFHDLEIDYADQECVKIEGGYSFKFTSLYAQGSANTAGIDIGADAIGVQLIGGMTRGHKKEGIAVAGTDTHVSAMRIEFNSYPTSLTYDGIKVLAGAKRTLVSNSLIGSTEGAGTQIRYGVYVEDGAPGTTITGCNFFGCLLGDVFDGNTEDDPVASVQVVAPNVDTFPTVTRIQGLELGCAAGRGALFTPTVAGGVITGVTVTDGGTDYTLAPNVVAIGGGGSGFAATATVVNGVVTAVSVSNGGTGYSSSVKIAAWSQSDVPTVRSRWKGQDDIALRLLADGVGEVRLGNDRGIGLTGGGDDLSSVNYVKGAGKASGSPPELQAQGPAADIDLALTPKGTGALKLNGPTSASAGAVSTYLTIKIGTTLYKLPCHAVS